MTTFLFFFFNDTATTEIYTLSLHDALPISRWVSCLKPLSSREVLPIAASLSGRDHLLQQDRALDRGCEIGRAHGLNSSHDQISYAVFCLKKKKEIQADIPQLMLQQAQRTAA